MKYANKQKIKKDIRDTSYSNKIQRTLTVPKPAQDSRKRVIAEDEYGS